MDAPQLSGAMPSGAAENKPPRDSFLTELKEGLRYTVENHFALTILMMNIINILNI